MVANVLLRWRVGGGLALCFPQFLIMKEGSREGRGVENMWYGKRYKTYTDRLYDFFPFRP